MQARQTVLIAEDNELNREMLKAILESDYDIIEASDGKEAIDYIRNDKDVALVLLDLYMPKVDGFDVLREIKKMGLEKFLPVIMISGENAVEAELKAFDLGVNDFIHKPYESTIILRRVRNSLELFQSRKMLTKKVMEQTEDIRKQNELLTAQAKRLKETNSKIIDILGTAVEFRHMESFEHVMRVKAFTRCIATQVMKDFPEYGLTENDVDVIASASPLHDLGKIAISDTILLKPGKLTKEEFEIMKTHTTKGCELLDRVDAEGIWDKEFGKVVYDICRSHHEKYDGKGYPDGLKGDEIPLSAQIVSVADVFDALICKRVYKDAYPLDVAEKMIVDGECGTFSPKIMQSFLNCRDERNHLAMTIGAK
jgi:putative two-component system response regulator